VPLLEKRDLAAQKRRLKLDAAEHYREPHKADSTDNEQKLDKLMTLQKTPDGASLARFIRVFEARLPLYDQGH
jgi:hypothetical protein